MPAKTMRRRRRDNVTSSSKTRKSRIRESGVTGWDCSIRLEHAAEGVLSRVEVHADSILPASKSDLPAGEAVAKAAKKLVQRCDPHTTAALLASMSNPHRLVILHRLLQGPATYRQLQATCNLKAGPLYHHISSLRLAGLVGPKSRDNYELSEVGLRLTLLSLLVPKLARARSNAQQTQRQVESGARRPRRGRPETPAFKVR